MFGFNEKKVETQRRKAFQRPNIYGMKNPKQSEKKFVSIGKRLAEERKSRQQGSPSKERMRNSYHVSAKKKIIT